MSMDFIVGLPKVGGLGNIMVVVDRLSKYAVFMPTPTQFDAKEPDSWIRTQRDDGYMLSNLMSLRTFDLSDNNIHDSIPYQLPPNITSLNLARNNLSGNLPYSISSMFSITYLNVSRNSLSQSVGDVFSNLSLFTTLDLSFNNFSGDLPSSISSLSNLSTLNVQNNQLTGSLDVLTGLPLTTLNVANNHFSGWIPQELNSIPNFIYDGNSFDNGPAPPSPPYTHRHLVDLIIIVVIQDQAMAIKKIDNAALSLQEEDNFLEAVSNMSRLRHPNIVSLVGYCSEHGQRLLVYEYIGNGSLHDMLHFADDGSKTLSWNARVRVALGTARALDLLAFCVHRNFKSANILVDEELNPHLSDCGLAALTPNTERQVSTQMVGSFGYSAPEFALSGVYTVKSDVYSFGVVMLELLTGRKPLDSSRVRSEQSLVRWATPQLHDIDALAKMPEPEFRPPMSEVVQALVRLVQRASVVKRHSSDESGFAYKTPEHEAINL
ncbi:hypothetical protein GH714_021210 [Hevea brasiliensis]|uniref:Protein kinase domain-containing protein n=1 Tax=Hevea brasiliensis TaxID=3981 RepID=A0A6A6LT82_HEVBR|nr:hypothetical protein GH714_021210 [Hevea brasiliensis]